MASLLIIDDDLDGADALSEMMRFEGHEVRVGYNGEEGLRLARERLPDLALLDVEMPLLDGPGMAHQMLIRNMGLESIPVVLLSGVINLKDVAAQIGTPYFLGKPYRYEDILTLVKRALTEHRAPRPGDVTSDPS
jgi:DNA-binding NtrC family response regulator